VLNLLEQLPSVLVVDGNPTVSANRLPSGVGIDGSTYETSQLADAARRAADQACGMSAA
jgi:hypothetical protein